MPTYFHTSSSFYINTAVPLNSQLSKALEEKHNILVLTMAAVSGSIRAEFDSPNPPALEGGGVKNQRRFPVPFFSSLVGEASMTDTIQSFCSMLEPLLQRVVHEVVQQKVDQYVDSLERRKQLRIDQEMEPSLQLVFTEQMPEVVYSKGKIRTRDNKPLQVKLIDAITGETVVSPPSVRPLKVEIVVLDGDFPRALGRNAEDSWTSEDFNRKLLKERKDKPPLLFGAEGTAAPLVQGLASFDGLEFTDNSRWRPSRKFVLGVVAALPAAAATEGSCGWPRIREAITNPFKVLESRGEAYKKHYPPRPNDEVWRLKQIAKDGPSHRRLNKAGIYTVEDFLRLLLADQNRLLLILGKSEKSWKRIKNHAMTCKLANVTEAVYPPQEGQTSNMGYSTNTLVEQLIIPQQMAMLQVDGQEIGGIMGASSNGDLMEQGGMLNWQPIYQLGSSTVPHPSNMQMNINFKGVDYGQEYDLYDCRGYP